MVRASVLTHSNPGPIAYLALSDDLQEALLTLEDMESLGAPTGYIVEIRDEIDTAAALLSEASLIVLEESLPASAIVDTLSGDLDELLSAVHENGATLLAEGNSATAFGRWISEAEEVLPALAWLENTSVTTGEDERSKALTLADIRLHIATESALALGPNGEIQLWGNQDVRITLGSEFYS